MWDQNGNPHKTLRVLAISKLLGRAEYTIAAKLGVSLLDDPRTKRIDEGRDQYTIMEMSEIQNLSSVNAHMTLLYYLLDLRILNPICLN